MTQDDTLRLFLNYCWAVHSGTQWPADQMIEFEETALRLLDELKDKIKDGKFPKDPR